MLDGAMRSHLAGATATVLVALAVAAPAQAVPTTCQGLGDAITAANAAPGPDVIDLPAGATCRIGVELPTITGALTIDGHGGALRAKAGTSPILLNADGESTTDGPLTLTVVDLTMSGGSTAIWAYAGSIALDHARMVGNGTAAYAIFGHVTATASRIARNGAGLAGDGATATDSELVGNGTAVSGLYDAAVFRSIVRRNATGVTGPEGATARDSILDHNGTALSSRDYLDLTGSRLTDNDVGLDGGRRQIVDSTVARNATVGASQFETTVTRSTFFDNGRGLEAGGGAFVTNSTFARGDELFARGGAIDFTTITGTLHSDQAISVTNSILGACDGVFAEDGVPSTASGNVSLDPGCPGLAVTADPRLRGLADNGGPTRTLGLGARSPARDLVPCGPATDQRGLPRPSGAACDAGAFEAQVAPAASEARAVR